VQYTSVARALVAHASNSPSEIPVTAHGALEHSAARKGALVNMIGNGVATLVVARWENELGRDTLQRNLA